MASLRNVKVLETKMLGSKHKKIVQETIELEDGFVCDWIHVDTPQSVMIIALTPDRRLVAVKEYRYTIKQDAYELPGGIQEEGEDETAAAERELQEETGFTAKEFVELGKYYVMPSETNRWITIYLALDAVKTEEPKLDSIVEKYFDMSVELLPLPEKLADETKIRGLESLYGIALAKEYLQDKN